MVGNTHSGFDLRQSLQITLCCLKYFEGVWGDPFSDLKNSFLFPFLRLWKCSVLGVVYKWHNPIFITNKWWAIPIQVLIWDKVFKSPFVVLNILRGCEGLTFALKIHFLITYLYMSLIFWGQILLIIIYFCFLSL